MLLCEQPCRQARPRSILVSAGKWNTSHDGTNDASTLHPWRVGGLRCYCVHRSGLHPTAWRVLEPGASVVKEQTLLRQSPRVEGQILIPDKRESVLIQPAGREWRYFHEV